MFGILKRRFNCLHVGMNVSPNTAALYVVACAILHNIGIEQGDIIMPDEQEIRDDDLSLPAIENPVEGQVMRDHLCQTFFS